jgi:glycosyltransferase involved in cell wall biosynthesis
LLRRERPTIVHTHTAMAGCLGRLAAGLCGVPIIVHTFHGNCLNEYFSPFRAAVFRSIEQLLARISDVLCVVSPQQAAELSEEFLIAPARKFRIVPLGLELEDYFALRPRDGNGPLSVGWFGRMVPVKNIALLAATIEEAIKCSLSVRFVIAGDGPDRSALNEVLDRHPGCVEWLGWQREILPVMARCDVLLQTSRNEGTPVALIQGMAAARPFVSTAAGGVVDMVTGGAGQMSDGAQWYANGVLAPPDASALANGLATLAENRTLVTRMGLAGRDLASQYRKEHLVANLDTLYRELLRAKSLDHAVLGRKS